jgi:hypothetical protein
MQREALVRCSSLSSSQHPLATSGDAMGNVAAMLIFEQNFAPPCYWISRLLFEALACLNPIEFLSGVHSLLPYYRKLCPTAKDARKRVLGDDHPNTLATGSSLVRCSSLPCSQRPLATGWWRWRAIWTKLSMLLVFRPEFACPA